MKFPGLAIPNDSDFEKKFGSVLKEESSSKEKKKKKKKDKDVDSKSDTKIIKMEAAADVIDDAMAALEALAPSHTGYVMHNN